jgi:hypothetical protein
MRIAEGRYDSPLSHGISFKLRVFKVNDQPVPDPYVIGQIPISLPEGGSSCSEWCPTRTPAVISEVTQKASKARILLDRRKPEGTEVRNLHPGKQASHF